MQPLVSNNKLPSEDVSAHTQEKCPMDTIQAQGVAASVP